MPFKYVRSPNKNPIRTQYLPDCIIIIIIAIVIAQCGGDALR